MSGLEGHCMRKYRILLVDNDKENWSYLQKLLAHDVDTVFNLTLETEPATALLHLKNQTHDAYFINSYFNDNQGLALIEQISSIQQTSPLILVSDSKRLSTEGNGFDKGASDYINICKITAESLNRTIRHALERKAAEKKYQVISAQYQVLLNSLADGVLGLDTKGNITFTNPAAKQLLAYNKQDLVERNILEILGYSNPQDPDEMINKIFRLPLIEREVLINNDEIFYRRKGEETPVEYTCTPVVNDIGVVEGAVLIFRDISTRKATEKQLAHLEDYDPLTGIANRHLFMKLLPQTLAKAERYNLQIAIIFLDIDNFKRINDTWGHEVGDKLLKHISKRLKKSLRMSDLVVRLGGDEFTVIVESAKNTRAIAMVAQKMLDTLAMPFKIDSREYLITASIGIATFPECATDSEQIIKCADVALYHAKTAGRNNFKFYTEEFNADIRKQIEIENMLSKSLANDEFVLHYQPQYDLKSKRVTGIEALIRWNNESLGFLYPREFIHIAENSQKISELGEWVLRTGIKQYKEWQSQSIISKDTKISINISIHQLDRGDIVSVINDILIEYAMQPEDLVLELTETSVMSDPIKSIAVLNELHDLGIKIAIDDFGTGYSSLSYLTNLPIDILKIDRAFIRDIFKDHNDAVIVRSIINLAKNLGFTVVAEGVEESNQAQFLEKHSCDHVQGYYYCKPLSVDEFEECSKNQERPFDNIISFDDYDSKRAS